MIVKKIVIDFCNNIRQFINEKRKLQKGHQWRPPSKIVNFWARIKCNSSKWLWEILSLISAIILDTSVMKNKVLWPIWWKDKSRLMKQLLCLSSWIIFDFKIKFSGKNWVEKTPIFIFSLFGSKVNEFGQVWTSLDEKNRKLKNCRKLT